MRKNIWIAFCSVLLTACNSLFYHPDKLSYSLPEQLSQNFAEHRIPVGQKGETLHAWHLRTTKQKKGTIVHFHGNAQNMTSHVFFVAWLLDEGYDLVTFDYRGYGKSDGEVSRESTIEDGIAVLKWTAEKIDPNKIFVVGQSLGGAIALVALSKSEFPAVQKIVLDSTFPSYRKLAQRKLASFFLTWPLQWPLSFLVSDNESPYDHLETLARTPWPFFIVHAEGDPVVPYSEGLHLARALESRAGSKVRFRTEPSRVHTVCMQSTTRNACMEAVAAFLDDKHSSTQTSEAQNQ